MNGVVLVNLPRPIICKTFGDFAYLRCLFLTSKERKIMLIAYMYYLEPVSLLVAQSKRPEKAVQGVLVSRDGFTCHALLMKCVSTRQSIIVTDSPCVLFVPPHDKCTIAPCNHEGFQHCARYYEKVNACGS